MTPSGWLVLVSFARWTQYSSGTNYCIPFPYTMTSGGCVCDINSRLMTCCTLLRRPRVSLQHFSDYYFFNREKIKYWSHKQDMRALICSHFSKSQRTMKYLYVPLWLQHFECAGLFIVVVKNWRGKKHSVAGYHVKCDSKTGTTKANITADGAKGLTYPLQVENLIIYQLVEHL